MAESNAHSADEYLMTIYLLAYPVGEYVPSRRGPQPTAPARIADQLGVSRASVGEMLNRLEAQGHVRRGEKKEAILTMQGRDVAMATVRRHRVVERLLTDVMGYSGAEAHEKADGLDEGFDDEMIERLFVKLDRPERCPHGYPIDPDHELRENPTLKALENVPAGTRVEVVRLAEHDGKLLNWFYDEHLEPGTLLDVVSIDNDGTVTATRVENGQTQIVPGTHANGLFVRKDGTPVVPADPSCWAEQQGLVRRGPAE